MAENSQQHPGFDAGHVPITEEMDSMRRTLPPFVPVAIAFVIVAILLTIYVRTTHTAATARYAGSIVKAVLFHVHVESSDMGQYGFKELNTEVEKRDQVVVLVQIQLNNDSKKPLYIKGVSATLPAASGKAEDDIEDQAAPASDYDRIFQAYPALAAYKAQALPPETKLEAGTHTTCAEIFSFQMTPDDFMKSKALNINLNLYDLNPMLLTIPTAQIQVVSAPATGHTKSKARHK